MITWMLLMTLASAGGDRVATTCQVVFIGPAQFCSWDQTMSTSGSGASKRRAARAATKRLLSAAETIALARELHTAGTLASAISAAERQSCPAAVAEHLVLSCFPEPRLEQPLTCFADFRAPDCWSPQLVVEEGVGWKAREAAHAALCEQVSEALASSELSPAEQQTCQARCALEANVRCPRQDGTP